MVCAYELDMAVGNGGCVGEWCVTLLSFLKKTSAVSPHTKQNTRPARRTCTRHATRRAPTPNSRFHPSITPSRHSLPNISTIPACSPYLCGAHTCAYAYSASIAFVFTSAASGIASRRVTSAIQNRCQRLGRVRSSTLVTASGNWSLHVAHVLANRDNGRPFPRCPPFVPPSLRCPEPPEPEEECTEEDTT